MLNKKADVDDLADLAEPLLDKASIKFLESFTGATSADFIESLPAGKLIITTARLFSSAKNHHRERHLKSFLQGLKAGNNTIEEFNKLSENDKSKLRGLVISQLDLQSDKRQAEAMGYAVDVYLSNKIDRLMLVGIISELKNINPLLFYFSEYNLYIDNGHTIYGRPIIKGPVHLLPAIFYSVMTEDSAVWSPELSTTPTPTPICKLFFRHIYEPMAEKYKSSDTK
jgi:hypothetical protein cdivTM_01456